MHAEDHEAGGTRAAADPLASLPPELQDAVRHELARGEEVIWATRPLAGRAVRWMWLLVPFGLVFALIGGVGAFATAVGACFGLPFMVVGGVFALAPLLVKRAMQRSVYALTGRRVLTIVARPFGGRSVTSFHAAQLGAIERKEYSDGTGSLIFRRDVLSDEDRTTVARGMLYIDRPAEAHRLITEVLLSPQDPEPANDHP